MTYFFSHFSMFNEEENDLFQDMKSLPYHSVMSKLNHVGKRAKTAIVILIIFVYCNKNLIYRCYFQICKIILGARIYNK